MPSPLDSFPIDHQPGTGNQVDLALGHHDEPQGGPQPGPVPTRHRQGLALGSAALMSAAVALLGVWLLGQSGPAGSEEDAAVTVSYEPLEEPGDNDADPAVLGGPAGAPTGMAGRAAPASHETTSPPRKAAGGRRTEPAQAARSTPADSARPAASATGLVIITTPPGARVTVNGVGWGAAPLTLGNLTPGTKRVRVSMAGYESEERVVGADISQTKVTLRIQLRAVPRNRQSR